MKKHRGTFGSKLGFVLAAAGSAVGLGNIWRFPYLAARYGGGVFLLFYILFVITFGFSLMIAELAIGRKTAHSPVGAFRTLDRRFTIAGMLAIAVCALVLPYYTVVGGWVMKYIATYLSGQGGATSEDAYFGEYISSSAEPVFWQVLFILLCVAIVIKGVKKGIEGAGKVLMPALVVLTVAVTAYSLFLPGAGAGVLYFLKPDFSRFSFHTIIAALGQMFYSMSLAMGIMITYGSYLKKTEDLEQSVKHIEWFDLGISILAGLMMIPPVFAFSGGDATAVGAGQGLMFQTLPKVFAGMAGGNILGAVFFLLILFAALTSAVSMLEVLVSNFCDQFHMKRRGSVLLSAALVLAAGIPPSLGYGLWKNVTLFGMNILDFMDFLSNSILMPLVALLTCLLAGWVLPKESIAGEVEQSSRFRRKKIFFFMIRYAAPAGIAVILVCSVLEALHIIRI